jgi:LPXTG-motif cell wall-anchored protein
VPTLAKELAFSNADAYTADAEECVTFQIYAGTSVNSTICTFATVTVPEGSSSAEITLDNLKVYRMVNGEWTVTDSNWTWANGTTYTVAEVNCGEDFYFGNFHNTTAQTYSFVYNPALKANIVCTNYAHDWAIELHKTDADDESIALPGAAFGLYSPVEADRVDIAAAKAAAGLDANVRVSAIKTYDGTVYYLTAIAVTDDMGNCQWNKLMEDSYIVAELQAPLGYVLDSTLHRIQRNGDETVTMTIENASGSAIPETGGAGIGLYMAAGTTLILASLCGAYLLWLKRRKQNA